MEIERKVWHRETATQKVIAADGSEQIIEREKFPSYHIKEKEVDVIFGGKDLGYGFKEERLYHFKSITGNTIKECQNHAKNMKCEKWDRSLK